VRLVAIALAAGATGWTWVAASGDVPFRARDLDCDGALGIGEWYSAGLDHGWRTAGPGAAGCSEVFALKDGRTVATWCDASPPCIRPR
jgi:hypothetical protein